MFPLALRWAPRRLVRRLQLYEFFPGAQAGFYNMSSCRVVGEVLHEIYARVARPGALTG